MDEDDKPKGPLVVRNSCLAAAPPSEAEILADRSLRLESDDLLFDPKARNERIEEIERILPLIQKAYPEVADIPVRLNRFLGLLTLYLDPGLYQTIEEILATEEEFVTLKTGDAEFDALTTELELQGIALSPSRPIFARVSLCFQERVNTDAASDVYSALESVKDAMPAYTAGGGPDIIALQEEGKWFFIFRTTRQNLPCPEDCGTLALFFFTVTGDEVQKIIEEKASIMLPFQELLSTRSEW